MRLNFLKESKRLKKISVDIVDLNYSDLVLFLRAISADNLTAE